MIFLRTSTERILEVSTRCDLSLVRSSSGVEYPYVLGNTWISAKLDLLKEKLKSCHPYACSNRWSHAPCHCKLHIFQLCVS